MLQTIIEYIAILCFIVLGIINLCHKPPQLDFAGLNFALVGLYVFLYIQPFSKVIK